MSPPVAAVVRCASGEKMAPNGRSGTPFSDLPFILSKSGSFCTNLKNKIRKNVVFFFFLCFLSAVSVCVLMRKSRGVLWVSGLERRPDVEGSFLGFWSWLKG